MNALVKRIKANITLLTEQIVPWSKHELNVKLPLCIAFYAAERSDLLSAKEFRGCLVL
jgi:hypothetical protein